MKVLVISAAYPPMHAGESANAHHLCTRLALAGLDVHVLTSADNVGANDAGVTVHPIMRRWSWREVPRLIRFVERCAPDAVLLMYLGGMYGYHPMMTFAPTMVKRRLPRVPFVTRYESPFAGATATTNGLTTRVIRKLAARAAGGAGVGHDSGTLLRDSDHVIVLCEGHRTVLAEEAPAARPRMVVIPPAPNVRVSSEPPERARLQGRAKLGVDADDFVIAFFGYMYPKKGIETLLEAFQTSGGSGDGLGWCSSAARSTSTPRSADGTGTTCSGCAQTWAWPIGPPGRVPSSRTARSRHCTCGPPTCASCRCTAASSSTTARSRPWRRTASPSSRPGGR